MVKVNEEQNSSYLFDEKAIRKFVRQMLKNHTFVGSFIEQRYVPELNRYKKIIKISMDEDLLIEDLLTVKRRIDKFYSGTKWVGITCPSTSGAPVGFNLWVDLDEVIFGTFKFCVKDVAFDEDEISLRLLVVEPYKDESWLGNSFRKRNSPKVSQSLSDFHHKNSDIEYNNFQVFSWKNMKEACIFLFLVTAAIVTGGGQIIMFLLDYILKLMKELSNIIRVLTPLFEASLETISKIFGYICFLIALLWRDRHSPTSKGQMVYMQNLQYQPEYLNNRYKALPYRPPNSVRITELNS